MNNLIDCILCLIAIGTTVPVGIFAVATILQNGMIL